MNIQNFSGLRARLILLVLLVAIPLVILVTYSGFELRNAAAADIYQNATHSVLMAVNEEQRLMKETRKFLSALAHVPQIQNGDAASCNRFLAKLQGEDGIYVHLGVIRLNGDVVCSGIPLQKALNLKDRAYFQRTLKNRDFSVGDYVVGRVTNTVVRVFSYPIFDDKKQLKAVLFAGRSAFWIRQLSSEAQLPTGSVVNVIDVSTGTLLAHYPESTVQLGSSFEKTVVIEAIHASGGTGTAEITDPNGVERLYTFSRLNDLRGDKEIYVSLGIPTTAVYAKANAIMARNLKILLFVVVLLLLITWYAGDAMVLRQVAGLLAVTRRLATGDLDVRVEVSDSKNEISELGREFNQMAVALKQQINEVKHGDVLLHKSEEDLQRIIETVPDIIYTATVANNFTINFVSPALTRILGFAPEEFTTDPDQWTANIHNEDRQRVITHRQSALDNTEDNISTEYRMWHKDGKKFHWFEDRARISRDAAGHATAIYGVITDVSEIKRYIADLEYKAMYDSLTDLPNRLLFLDRLKHALKVAQRSASPLAVFTVDVVRLREVNDTLGHGSGDLVLQEVASRLQKDLRESDTVARLGGDEYAIVLPDMGTMQVLVAARKIQKLFEQPVSIDGTSLEIEAMIGIAVYPEHGDEPDLLLQHADIAMHVAKNEARGFSIYNVENAPYSLRKLQLLGELRKAIEHKELALYYQPQIDLKTGRVASVEALARWPHPVEGMIPPGDFIPMVEQSGLIRPFTLWVLEEAIMQIKRWSEAGIDLTIAVNLSTRNLLDSGLPGSIAKLLNVHNVSPAHLTLEVTESAVMSRPEMALKVLIQLHNMGHKLSIDDFGTGYSSLAYLKKLPVYELKIDQSFVFGLTTDDDDAVIVRSTIELGHNMGLKVLAEGVENQDILDTLKILRCDIAQGYYMSRPLPAEELEQWLIDSPWGLKKDSI